MNLFQASLPAIATTDFVPFNSTITLSNKTDSTTVCATLAVIDDSVLEENEQLFLNVSAENFLFLTFISILDTIDSEGHIAHMYTMSAIHQMHALKATKLLNM